ncbi:MAG: LysR substrate-binding domain-containing protein [Beijerinckiaceae bacterium]
MTITLKQIEAFRAVMAGGGITRGAQNLGVSQPAISRMMADLEAEAGFPLFAREGRNAAPTPRARLLLAEVERTLLGLSHLEGVVRALREGGEGRMSIALPPSLLPAIAEQLIGPFARRHPEASIAIEIVPSFQAMDPLVFRQHDLCMTFEPFGLAGFEELPIGRAQGACVVPADHPLAQRNGPLQLRDIADEPFISYWPDAGFRLEVDRLFESAGLRRDIRCEARTTAAVCELVAALGGVSIVPIPGPDITSDTRLAALVIAGAPQSNIRILRPPGAMSVLAQSFLAFAMAAGLDFTRYIAKGRRGRSR